MIERNPEVLRLVGSDGTMNDITGINFGETNVRTFSIFNRNPYALQWEIVNTEEWITINPISGTINASSQQPITVTIDRSKKDNEVTNANISVISETGTRDLFISTFGAGTATLTSNVNPASSGIVSRSIDAESYPLGTPLTITAVAANGFVFKNWTGANVADANSATTTLILSANTTITANFQQAGTIDIPDERPSLAAQLMALHANAESSGEYTVEIGSNQNIGAQGLSFSDRTDITIRIVGIGAERIISLTDNGSLFSITNGVTLILDENIRLQGRSNNNSSLISVNSRGTLIMKNGSRISNNTRGVLVGTDGSFFMEGGEISQNVVTSWSGGGGGVYVDNGGFFSMTGGKISGNTASYGAGVYVENGLFVMENGEISGNTASSSGGGVHANSGKFTMIGGRISGNRANSDGGGGVRVGNATFTMEGGEISANTANSGGGAWVANNGTFTKNGGIIHGYALGDNNRNTATAGIANSDRGHAVFVNTNPNRRRETTAGVELNLNSDVSGAAGGWE
jgi:hypothetical protein